MLSLSQVRKVVLVKGQYIYLGLLYMYVYRYLSYYFYGQDYLGAAHGTAGILYMLLQCPVEWCRERDTQDWIIKTLDHLLTMQLPDGNFPTKDYKRSDSNTPVHWCHGAPGIIPCLYKAHEIYKEDSYLRAMNKGLECIWRYGIIKKGYGTCHGITGNAYTYLTLYSLTGKEEYYYNALSMADSVWNESISKAVYSYNDPQRFAIGQPDTPMSLMEGLGGVISFFCDLLHPKTATFPGLQ